MGHDVSCTYETVAHAMIVRITRRQPKSTLYPDTTLFRSEPAAVTFTVTNTNQSCSGTTDATITVSNITGGLAGQTSTTTVDGLAPTAT